MKNFLVCIDSDGCVFDTMEVKHKECFCPAYINYFGLQAVSKYARDAWDYANLYSCYRGIHRILSALKALDVLAERRDVKERGFTVPEMRELRAYVAAGNLLSNDGIKAYLVDHPESTEMQRVLDWSLDVNKRVAELVRGVPPFPHVRESLQCLSEVADIVIVSATPQSALEREWAEHGLIEYVTAVKGQESGSKKEIIASLKDAYVEDHVLMIGDAPGDLKAAHDNGVLFYPICPDKEADSWARFAECKDAFLAGTYRGQKEEANVTHFNTLLPETPFWN